MVNSTVSYYAVKFLTLLCIMLVVVILHKVLEGYLCLCICDILVISWYRLDIVKSDARVVIGIKCNGYYCNGNKYYGNRCKMCIGYNCIGY